MKVRSFVVCTGVSLCALVAALPVYGQTATQAESATTATDPGDIIVTARREAENLQDVPQSIAVVTSEQTEKYNILRMLDVQKIVPGLVMSDGNGLAQNTSMRGVTFNQVQALPQTVAFYLNDVNIRPQQAYQAFFDIGQVEVLRGPQGTVRGVISPSGAITLTTRRPNLDEIGGYVSGTVGTLHNSNLQGALSVPIVPGKLGVRIAGLRDVNSQNGVRSIFSTTEPKQRSEAVRATVLAEPTDNLRAVFTFQHFNRRDVFFAQTFGNGSPGVPGNPFAPPGFNGPPIAIEDQRSNAAGPETSSVKGEAYQAQIDWTIPGHKLSYVGGHGRFKTLVSNCRIETNTAPFPCFPQDSDSDTRDWSHEFRLASVDPLFGAFDYTLGYLRSRTSIPTIVPLAENFLSGAFGSPLGPPRPGTPLYKYAVNGTLITIPNRVKDDSLYGSLTFHLGERTSITGGARWSNIRNKLSVLIPFEPATIAFPLPANFCAGAGGQFQATYPGVCDIPVVIPPFNFDYSANHKPWIYNVEVSHHFNDDLMIYAKTANSFRMGQIQLALAIGTDNPDLRQYLVPRPEKSTSYEAGIKGSLFDNRLQFDVTYFHQKFDGYLYYTLPTYYLQTQGPSVSVSTVQFTTNADAVIDGVELSVTARPIPQWTTTFNFNWTKGRLSNASIPCNSSQFNGTNDEIAPTVAQFQAAGQSVALCNSNASTTTGAPWNLNVQSEYQHAFNGGITGFIRGLATIRPRNPNVSRSYAAPSHTLLDLYLGLRSTEGQWELAAYGKNITNNRTVLDRLSTDTWGSGLSNFFGEHTGYFGVTRTPRREFGITARYAFGSD
jgi:iron complex outermembrane recepter protein